LSKKTSLLWYTVCHAGLKNRTITKNDEQRFLKYKLYKISYFLLWMGELKKIIFSIAYWYEFRIIASEFLQFYSI